MVSAATPVPLSGERAEERIYAASQWQLMRWRFMKHKLAVVSLVLLGCFYTVAIFCEFVAPNDPLSQQARYHLSPPQKIHFVDESGFHLRPFVYGTKGKRDAVTLRMVYEEDRTVKHPIRFLQRGDKYMMWGMWDGDLHLFGIEDQDARLLLFGADTLGRCTLSRIVYGARLSLSIGFVGVMLSLVLGIVLGGISGYFGGATDMIIQRIIELLQAIPGIPLWLTLAAALPREWSNIQIYFAITVILAIQGWTGLGRVVRGKFLALREEDFVLAAKLVGSSELRIILRHMVPSFASHLIAVLTLRVPGMILAETSLSFLGLGLQAPVISWGVLLSGAQNIATIAQAPWLFLPGVAIIVTVLCFNFAGDGLRDAADPYVR